MLLEAIARNNFVVVGRAGIDFFTDAGVRAEDAERLGVGLGGSAANIGAGICKLGGKAALVTRVSATTALANSSTTASIRSTSRLLAVNTAIRLRSTSLWSRGTAMSSTAMVQPTFKWMSTTLPALTTENMAR